MFKFQRITTILTLVLAITLSFVAQADAAKSDYNHDGSSDILFQHSDDGRLLLWNMTNFTRSLHFPKSLATAWSVKGKGDFNGDGTSDVLYMKDAGDTAIALMQDSARSGLTFPGGIKTVWSVKGVGDFDGDGTDDILFQRSTDGVTMIWGIKNAARNKISYPGALASFWRIAGIGDFNNDGTDDILCQHIDDGRLLIWQMNNLARTSVKYAQSLANSWKAVGVGDFNNDGTDDVLYRKDAGNVAIAEMSNFSRSNLKFPGGIRTVWDVKDAGDYNGDGTDDILFRRSTDGVTLIWGMNNSARASVNWSGGLLSKWVVLSNTNRVGTLPLAYVHWRNYEDPLQNQLVGYIQLPVGWTHEDIKDVKLLDSKASILLGSDDLFPYVNYSLYYNCMTGECTGDNAPETQYLYWFSSSSSGITDLATGTYKYVVTTKTGNIAEGRLDYQGKVSLPIVSSSTFSLQKNSDGSLTANWVNPTDDPSWGEVDQVRLLLTTWSSASGAYTDLLVKMSPADASSVTIPEAEINKIWGESDKETIWMLVQTRKNDVVKYDAEGTNYTRGSSNWVRYSPYVSVAPAGTWLEDGVFRLRLTEIRPNIYTGVESDYGDMRSIYATLNGNVLSGTWKALNGYSFGLSGVTSGAFTMTIDPDGTSSTISYTEGSSTMTLSGTR